MTIELPPICTGCVHYIERRRCKAFPQGIPADIIQNAFDHRQPHPHDGGITFEPIDERAATVAATYFDKWHLASAIAAAKSGVVRLARDWNEDDHPRDSHGRFAGGGEDGGSDTTASNSAEKGATGGYHPAKYTGDAGLQHFAPPLIKEATDKLDSIVDSSITYENMWSNNKVQPAFDIAYDQIPDTPAGREEGHPQLYQVCEAQGFNGPAEITDEAGIKEAVANGDIELYRGVSTEAFAQGYMYGKNYAGSGVYGNGTYAAAVTEADDDSAYRTAKDYSVHTNNDTGQADGYGVIEHMALSKDARVVDTSDLEHEIAQISSPYTEAAYATDDSHYSVKESLTARLTQSFYSEVGRYAAMKGYDAIREPGNPPYYVVLNRTALKISSTVRGGENGAPSELLPPKGK